MRLPRVRFTVRQMMTAVAVAAAVLYLEPFLFHFAAEEVRSGDPTYIWSEAVTVWVILNVAISIPIGVIAAVGVTVLRGRTEAKKQRIG